MLVENLIHEQIREDVEYEMWEFCLPIVKERTSWDNIQLLIDPCAGNGILEELIRDKTQIIAFDMHPENENIRKDTIESFCNRNENDEKCIIMTKFIGSSWKEDFILCSKIADLFAVIVPEEEFKKNSFNDKDFELISSTKIPNCTYVFNIYEKRNHLIDKLLKHYFGKS